MILDNNNYNDINEKKIIEFINSNGFPIKRMDIKRYAFHLNIKDRTLSDILKRSVKNKRIKRLSYGLYMGKCNTFYTYDNHTGEARWCINCGKPENTHK